MLTPEANGQGAGYGQIKQWFNAVCDLPNVAAQRAALQALGADSAAQAQVPALLAPAGGVTRFSHAVAQTASDWQGAALHPGDRLGPWTLLRPLGEGGMGRVFLAERSDGHYRQQVAIKLLLGWSGAPAWARLTAERQLLARMNHAHIAKLLDGGSTPTGQPYLVTEYAEGDTIDVWCAQRCLPLAARLALFQTVCDGVAHAHRHLVMHCDIKPANVVINAEGRAMLLGFGIAHLQGQGDVALAMTPQYASPELAAGQAPGMASDIFSLGRLLAELVLPVAASHRRGAELAAVVAKAAATDAEQRYDSVGALQRDLQRLLAHRPITALQGQRAYVLRKGLRRHWPWALAATAVLALTAVLGLALARQVELAQAATTRAEQAALRGRLVRRARAARTDDARLLGAARLDADEALMPGRMDHQRIPACVLAGGRGKLAAEQRRAVLLHQQGHACRRQVAGVGECHVATIGIGITMLPEGVAGALVQQDLLGAERAAEGPRGGLWAMAGAASSRFSANSRAGQIDGA